VAAVDAAGKTGRRSLGDGHNVGVFDLQAAQPVNCFLFEATSVNFEFRQAANPYFAKKE
jgi:hypothetical protein